MGIFLIFSVPFNSSSIIKIVLGFFTYLLIKHEFKFQFFSDTKKISYSSIDGNIRT